MYVSVQYFDTGANHCVPTLGRHTSVFVQRHVAMCGDLRLRPATCIYPVICTASTRRLNASRHTSVNPRNALGTAMQYRACKLFNAVSTLVYMCVRYALGYTAIGTTAGRQMPATCGRDVAGEWWPGAGQMVASINRKWPHRVDTSSWQAAVDARCLQSMSGLVLRIAALSLGRGCRIGEADSKEIVNPMLEHVNNVLIKHTYRTIFFPPVLTGAIERQGNLRHMHNTEHRNLETTMCL
ncbi:hypothetical protein K438DRAFT_1932732 [Mycena galopus ATCC 62051]|nr:hypothetical protein K438DRAFT_1932732 [Mycena galopus ATCC 62051]